MFNMKRFLHLMLAVVMLLSCFQIPYAYADDEPVTVTLNVTNTLVRGDVALEKTGMQLIRFADGKDALSGIQVGSDQLAEHLCCRRCHRNSDIHQ